MFFKDLGQFGGFHRIPEVEICLYTKFQVHRRELKKHFFLENFEFLFFDMSGASKWRQDRPYAGPRESQSRPRQTPSRPQAGPKQAPSSPKQSPGSPRQPQADPRQAQDSPRQAPGKAYARVGRAPGQGQEPIGGVIDVLWGLAF